MEQILLWHRSKLMVRNKHAGDVDDVVKDLKLDQIALRSFRFATK